MIPGPRVDHILDTIGTFRMGAPILPDDVRFASMCDGLDLSDVSPKQLTEVLKMRCTPTPDRYANNATAWMRKW